jgi:hypothetical protein
MRNRNVSELRGGARHTVLDGGDAFVPDFRHGFIELKDGDAEAFGEEFITAATSAEAVGESARDEVLDDELGGSIHESFEDELARRAHFEH